MRPIGPLRRLKRFGGLLAKVGQLRRSSSKLRAGLRRDGWRFLLVKLRRVWNEESIQHGYDLWLTRYGEVSEAERLSLTAALASEPAGPLISILLPTYNPRLEWLQQCVQSVQGQIYPHWQLCIADDASTDPAVRPWLEDLAGSDPRIRVVFRPVNGHIAAASNSALELAAGAWLGLLDHDDRLSEDALCRVVEAIRAHPDAGLFYSDEDKLDGRGRRCDPHFKSAWNPELFRSQNMLCHFGVYSTALVRRLGGFRAGFEGAQDYDLALRCIEHLDERCQIVHIPRVLYHWRSHSGSTARSGDAKPYSLEAGRRALADHLARTGQPGTVELTAAGYRLRHPLPAPSPRASLLIPSRNGLALLRTCLDSVLSRTAYRNFEILIIDNGSDDPDCLAYLRQLEADGTARVLRDPRPFNYSALNNLAARQAAGEVLVLLNNDIEVISEDWLEELISHAVRPGIGAVGAKLLFPDGSVQHAGVLVGMGGVAGHTFLHLPREENGYFSRASLLQSVGAVTGACLAVRRDHFFAVGGLNETDLAVGLNDIDFCLRLAEAGLRNVYAPAALLFHHESASRGADELDPAKRARLEREKDWMRRRWGESLRCDPTYNPNLILEGEPFAELASPPRLRAPRVPADWPRSASGPGLSAAGDAAAVASADPDAAARPASC